MPPGVLFLSCSCSPLPLFLFPSCCRSVVIPIPIPIPVPVGVAPVVAVPSLLSSPCRPRGAAMVGVFTALPVAHCCRLGVVSLSPSLSLPFPPHEHDSQPWWVVLCCLGVVRVRSRSLPVPLLVVVAILVVPIVMMVVVVLVLVVVLSFRVLLIVVILRCLVSDNKMQRERKKLTCGPRDVINVSWALRRLVLVVLGVFSASPVRSLRRLLPP
jgi:hypothetical protein